MKLEKIRRKYGPVECNLTIDGSIIDEEIRKSKEHGIDNPKVIAFPFIVFWKRRLKGKKFTRGIFRIFEARYNIEKKKLTIVSIIQAPGIYRKLHNTYYFGRLKHAVQVFDVDMNNKGDNTNFLCTFGISEPEVRLKHPNKNYKQFIFGSFEEIEERPYVELYLKLDKSNIFYNQGFYFCDWSAKDALKSLEIGFFGGMVHYLTFSLIYEGIVTAITSIKPFVRTAGLIISSIKNEFNK